MIRAQPAANRADGRSESFTDGRRPANNLKNDENQPTTGRPTSSQNSKNYTKSYKNVFIYCINFFFTLKFL
jgi:hypothetical protein